MNALCSAGCNLQDALPEPRTFSPLLFLMYLQPEQTGGAHLLAPHPADGILSQLGITLLPDDSSEPHHLHVCRKKHLLPLLSSALA